MANALDATRQSEIAIRSFISQRLLMSEMMESVRKRLANSQAARDLAVSLTDDSTRFHFEARQGTDRDRDNFRLEIQPLFDRLTEPRDHRINRWL